MKPFFSARPRSESRAPWFRHGPLALLSVALAAAPAAGQTAAPAAAANAQDVTGEIDRIFSWATPATPGCAVAASRNGQLVVNRAYGLADVERGIPLTPASVFDVGSLVKQFVAASVLLLVEDGRLSLSDDIRKHLPELPDYGQPVTVDHLLTHTSGVRDWTGMLPLTADRPDALTLTLRQRGLNFAPGEEWAYSNGGYVLLKEIVARVSGMPFSEFTRRRLFEPLGMRATAYREDLGEVENRALAYERRGDTWRQEMLLGNERGGGGALLSTATDLITWNEALANGRLGAFVSEKIQEPARLGNGRRLGYARGLFLDTNRAGRVVWHGGSAAAYKSVLTRFPEQGLSVAILCNAGEAADGRVQFARRIFDLFVPPTAAPGAQPAAAAEAAGAAGPELAGKAGLFVSEPTGEMLRLVVDDGRLRMAGSPPLVTVTADRFRNPNGSVSFRSQDEFELTFLSADEFELRSMEGQTTRYRRAQPYAPTAADLQAFAGRYQSDELGTVFQATAGDNLLVMRLEHAPDQVLEFRPVTRDTFQRGMMMVRFRRNSAGTVEGLDYSNPLLRSIRFTRLGDGGGR